MRVCTWVRFWQNYSPKWLGNVSIVLFLLLKSKKKITKANLFCKITEHLSDQKNICFLNMSAHHFSTMRQFPNIFIIFFLLNFANNIFIAFPGWIWGKNRCREDKKKNLLKLFLFQEFLLPFTIVFIVAFHRNI